MEKHETFRKLFLDSVDRSVKDGDIISLSGGVDSITLLFACIHLKKKVECITVGLENFRSLDVQVASSVTSAFKIPFTYLPIKRSYKNVFTAVYTGRDVCDVVKKTLIQCYYATRGMYDYAVKNGGRLVTGMMADNVYGLGKERMMQKSHQGHEYWMWVRKNGYYNFKNVFNDTYLAKIALEKHGVLIVDPYDEEKFVKFVLELTYNDQHRPNEKEIVKKAFIDYWSKGKWFRQRDNLQIGSGIREYHDTMLNSKYNKGHKKIIGIYNDIAQGRIKYDGER